MKNKAICPQWTGPMLAASVRQLFHNPARLLKEYLFEGMMIMDVGCEMGVYCGVLMVSGGDEDENRNC